VWNIFRFTNLKNKKINKRALASTCFMIESGKRVVPITQTDIKGKPFYLQEKKWAIVSNM